MTFVRSAAGTFSVGFFSMFAVALMGPGCESDETETGDEQNVVPTGSDTPFELAGLCQENIQRHITVRPQELTDGVVRWQCGDRPGVDGIDDRGQEYCEYFAVSNGKRVDNFADADPAKPLACFFTSVYLDVAPGTTRDAALATALGKKENLNAKVDKGLVRMKGQFNSRGAATTLVSDSVGVAKDKNDERQAACFLASIDPANKANAEKLKDACNGKDLSVTSAWTKATKLGAKIPKTTATNYEMYKDRGLHVGGSPRERRCRLAHERSPHHAGGRSRE